MIRIPTLILLFCVTCNLLVGQEKNLTSDSKIERVIVFLHGAQIERTAQVAIANGTSIILFQDLSPEIDEQSIQVKGSGSFTILSINRQSNYLNEQKVNEDIQRLVDRITDLKDEQEIQQNNIQILIKEEQMLASNQSIGNGGAGLDLNKLKQALEFQKTRLTENKLKKLSSTKEIKKLDEQIRKLQNQVNEIKGKSKSNTSDIAVKVNAKSSVIGTFKISYLVKNATWYPTYDLRATDVNKPVELTYRANISQQSGEEWKNVKLVLSSGDPSRGGTKPSLRPYQIGYNISNYTTSSNITNVSGKITDAQDGSSLPGVSVRIKDTSIGTSSNASGYYSIQIPSPNSILQYSFIGYEAIERPVFSAEANLQLKADQQSLNEVVVTGYNSSASVQGKVKGLQIRGNSSKLESIPLQVEVQENQTSVQFEIEQSYSISTDGRLLTVEIAEHQLKADYRYYAVPKLREEAYLTAAITGISELNLLSGEANIFFEGAFLGKTLINMENISDTLSVSLGADKNVLVKRVQQKEQNEKSFIGSNQRATRVFSFEILSRKSQPVKLTLEDQIPVSNTSEVTVESQELSGAKLDEATGMLKWELELQPNEKKVLKMTYQVKYPKNKKINLE
ncbi:MAG: mucoidy inhibitor MuiA family protein [Pyrinomonadaceae bacterium]|nr:mucoidy inhibitor MuiA family protein [Sphingobacteriaceae bacterium]